MSSFFTFRGFVFLSFLLTTTAHAQVEMNLQKKIKTDSQKFSTRKIAQNQNLTEKTISEVEKNNSNQDKLNHNQKPSVALKLSPLGLPWPAQLGAEARINEITYGASYGLLPVIGFNSGIKVNSTNINLTANYNPWKNNFYTGLGLGYYQATGYQNQNLSGNDVKFIAVVNTTYLYPHLGWRWKWPSNWFVSLELGLVVPVNSKTTNQADAPFVVSQTDFYKQEKQRIEDEVKKYTQQILPQITLLNIGYEF